MTEFGEALKRIRKSKGFTQREFARLMGLNHSTIASFEKPGANPRLGTVVRFLETLGLGLGDLQRELAVGREAPDQEEPALASLEERVARLEGLEERVAVLEEKLRE